MIKTRSPQAREPESGKRESHELDNSEAVAPVPDESASEDDLHLVLRHADAGSEDADNSSESVRQKVDLGDYDSFASHLVRFSPPEDLSPEHAALVSKVVVLDHRSLHALGPRSPQRAEVKALLMNAVISAGYSFGDSVSSQARPIGAAAALYEQAADIFERHIQSQNRGRYLAGVVLGILLLTAVATLVGYLPDAVQKAISPELLPALIWFAGLGAIVSVLLRLSKLDLVREISRSILIVSGMGRPFVASAFALVVCLIIKNKLVAVSFGDGAPTSGVYFVLAFMCGFSERFAQDILDRAEAGFSRTPGARPDR